MAQWPTRMNRARLFVLLDALEEDLRSIIEDRLVPQIGATEALGVYAGAARQKMLGDPAADPASSSPVDYLYLAEATALLNTRSELLPSDLADAIRQHTAQIDQLSPVRNRVMHGRPLLAEDPVRAVELGNALLSTGCQFENLAEVMTRLNSDPTWEPAYLPSAPMRESVLHNLPLPDFDETGLIGRAPEARDLLKRLVKRREPVLTLVGEGGVGKTALAVKVLYDLIDSPDCPYEAVLWTSLKSDVLTVDGIRPLLDATTGLRGMLAELAEPIDESYEGSIEELSKSLDGTNTLVVIDNLETADASEIIRLYDSLPDSCSFLFTSRIGLGQLERRIALGPLSRSDAANLFRQLSRQRGLEHLADIPQESVTPIVDSLRRNPLALKWYVLSIESGHEPDLALENQDVLLEFCVRSVYQALSEEGRGVLADIYALDRPVLFSEIAVLSDAGDELDPLRQALHELQRSSLVEVKAEIGDRVSQAFSLTPSAQQFLARMVAVDDVRRAEIRARDQQLRTRYEARERDVATAALAPHVVYVRSHLDSPVADILSDALNLSRQGDEQWRDRLATAERLAPGYFEVPRVHAFIESSAGRVDNATSLYKKALGMTEGTERAIICYFMAGHLARTAKDPAAALPYAKEAADALKEDRATIQHGSVLMYLERFDEAEPLFEQTATSASGLTRLIAVTSLVSLDRRRSEWIREHEHNPLLSAQSAIRGVRRGMRELSSGTSDRKLTSAVVQAIADGLATCIEMSNLNPVVGDLADVVRWVRLNENAWKHFDEWKYVAPRMATLKRRTDLPHELALLFDDEESVSPSGVGERHAGTVLRMIGQDGYGFLKPDGLDSLEVYFHVRDLHSRHDRVFCMDGLIVEFLLLQNSRGPYAKDLVVSDAERDRLASQIRTGPIINRRDRFLFVSDSVTAATVFMNMSGPKNRRDWSRMQEGVILEFRVGIGEKGPKIINHSAQIVRATNAGNQVAQ